MAVEQTRQRDSRNTKLQRRLCDGEPKRWQDIVTQGQTRMRRIVHFDHSALYRVTIQITLDLGTQ